MGQKSDDDSKKNDKTETLDKPQESTESISDESINFGGVLQDEKWSILAENPFEDNSKILIAMADGAVCMCKN